MNILIVDDHAELLSGIKLLLEEVREVACVDTALTGRDALEMTARNRYDLVILDISLPDADGLSLVPRIRNSAHHPKVLILSGFSEDEYVRQAFRAGASGYLMKSRINKELNRAIQKTAAGKTYLKPFISS